MKHFLWLPVVVALYSCGSETSEVGIDFFEDGLLDVSYIDSSRVSLSTVKFDSLVTSGAQRILLGSSVDEKLGRITALSYLQVGIENAVDLDDSKISFDYLALVLTHDGYSYYDTTSVVTLNAHFVTDEIEPATLYNTSQFKINSEILGSVSFIPKPNKKDSIEIVLSSSFGQAFFKKAQDGDDDLQTNEEFVEYLKGFAIVPDSTSPSAMLGFTTSASLRLYYYDKNTVPVQQKFVSFPVSSGKFSTRIITNHTNSYLKNLSSYSKRISADLTDDEAYIQSGAGLGLRVDMPYLRSLKQNTNFYVTQAFLEICPVRKSYSGLSPLPETLSVYYVNKKNEIYGQASSGATLYEDSDLQRDTRYVIDITGFVKAQMDLVEFNENALLFLPANEDFKVGADRVCFHSRDYEYKTRLRIYYATINE